MRIAIVTHGVSPFGHLYARAFRRHGQEAEVFSLTPVPEKMAEGPVTVVGPSDFRPWDTPSRLAYLKTVRPLRRGVRRFGADVVFGLYLSSGGVMACLSGGPHVAVSAQGSDVNTRIGSRLWRRVFRWEARKATVVHAVSEPLADTLHQHFGIDRRRIHVSPVGVDTEFLQPVEPDERPNENRVIDTRAHRPVYRQETVVRAAVRLRDRGVPCRVTFTSTRDAERTHRLVDEHGAGDVVTFRDGYAYEELPRVLGAADVYVSASESDGTSQSLLEAMATETFPVVSDIPANRPWVEHEKNGLLFPVGDDAALADCLERAFADEALRARAAPLNRRIARERGDVYNEARKLLAAFKAHMDEEG